MNLRAAATASTLILTVAAPGHAQSGGREPEPGEITSGGTTLVNASSPVTSAGVLRVWQCYASQGARVMLKVYRPEGDRLVLVGTSALESAPAALVATFTCTIPVARSDLVGCFCPDDTCVDRFPDGLTLTIDEDAGTRSLDDFTATDGNPSVWAGSSYLIDIPSRASSDLVLPVAARQPGFNDTRWVTALSLFNAAHSDTTVALFFNRSNQDNTSPAASATVVLPARATVVFEDLLADVFELEQDTGAVDIVASAPVLAHARIANTGDGNGTFGQTVPSVPSRWALGNDSVPGINQASDTFYLFELREDQDWRSNLGVVNVSAVPLAVDVVAVAGAKDLGQPIRLELAPFSHTQVNRVLQVLGIPAGARGVRLDVRAVQGSTARFFAYASRVDNRTGDAVYLPGQRESALQ